MNTREQEEKLLEAYRQTFMPEAGRDVLDNLMAQFYIGDSLTTPNEDGSVPSRDDLLIREGQREVVLYILKMIRIRLNYDLMMQGAKNVRPDDSWNID